VTITALYDACVLYPPSLRDLLVQLALTGLFRAKWTDEIHDEWIGAVLRNPPPGTTREKLERTRDLMNVVARERDCLVTDYQELISSLQMPDPNDRHVLAAAIHARADLIVTKNLKHFPPAVLGRHGVEAQHPDEFFKRLLGLSRDAVCAAAKTCRLRKKKPPKTVEEYLADLERQELPQTVARLRQFADLL
jgi:predicted nucleic acid-binding protein